MERGAFTLTNCWYDGEIRNIGNDGRWSGGLLGRIVSTSGETSIEHCLNTADISSEIVSSPVVDNCNMYYECEIKYVDVLVDGKFEEDKKNISLALRGSSNQRVIDVKETLKGKKLVLFNLDNE